MLGTHWHLTETILDSVISESDNKKEKYASEIFLGAQQMVRIFSGFYCQKPIIPLDLN